MKTKNLCGANTPFRGYKSEFFFFFNLHYNPGWDSACSTVIEQSHQEGFTECRCQRHV
jgi:hypothetical protein